MGDKKDKNVRLCNSDLAIAYLNHSFERGGFPLFLSALKKIWCEDAGMTMTDLARKTGLCRETLYLVLSPNGNPTMKTIIAILNAFGIRMVFMRE